MAGLALLPQARVLLSSGIAWWSDASWEVGVQEWAARAVVLAVGALAVRADGCAS